MSSVQVLRNCGLVGVMLLFAGCSSSVIIEDSAAFMPEIEVARQVGNRVAFQLDVRQIRGDGSSDRDFNRNVSVGNINIPQPDSLYGDFSLTSVGVGVQMQPLDRPRMGLRTTVGIRRTSLDLTLRDHEDTEYRYRGASYGPGAALEFIIPFGAGLSGVVHSDWNAYWGGDVGTQTLGGLKLMYEPLDEIALFVGWYESFYRNREYSSDIKLRASGLNAGVRFSF